jgi:ATP-dependent helicase/nuclease subunit A
MEVLVWSPNKDADCAAIARAREDRRDKAAEEYRRLLYVAMTRAEERLTIAGHRGKRDVQPESWRAMIEAALRDLCTDAPAPWGGEETVLLFGAAEAPAALDLAPPPVKKRREKAPDWLSAPAPTEPSALPPLRPSSALEGAEDFAAAAQLSPQRAQALEEGRLLHRLLQFLPDLAAPSRHEAALGDLLAQGVAAERAEHLAQSVLRVLDDPNLAPLFGENSIAEARIAARLPRPDSGFVDIAGAIDRLAETPESVWLVDYKTGTAGAAGYVAQLALYRAAVALLYPGKAVRCFLIFTAGPQVEEIPAAKLDAALTAAFNRASRQN